MRLLRALWCTICVLILTTVIPYVFGALLSIFFPILRGDSMLTWTAGAAGIVICVILILTFWTNYEADER